MRPGAYLPEIEAIKSQKMIADVDYSYVSFKNLPEEHGQWLRTSDLDLMRKSKDFRKNSSAFFRTTSKAVKLSKSLSTRSRQSSQVSQADSSNMLRFEVNSELIRPSFELEAKCYGLSERFLGKRSPGIFYADTNSELRGNTESQQVDTASVELLKERIFGKEQYQEMKNSKSTNKKLAKNIEQVQTKNLRKLKR